MTSAKFWEINSSYPNQPFHGTQKILTWLQLDLAIRLDKTRRKRSKAEVVGLQEFPSIIHHGFFDRGQIVHNGIWAQIWSKLGWKSCEIFRDLKHFILIHKNLNLWKLMNLHFETCFFHFETSLKIRMSYNSLTCRTEQLRSQWRRLGFDPLLPAWLCLGGNKPPKSKIYSWVLSELFSQVYLGAKQKKKKRRWGSWHPRENN